MVQEFDLYEVSLQLLGWHINLLTAAKERNITF